MTECECGCGRLIDPAVDPDPWFKDDICQKLWTLSVGKSDPVAWRAQQREWALLTQSQPVWWGARVRYEQEITLAYLSQFDSEGSWSRALREMGMHYDCIPVERVALVRKKATVPRKSWEHQVIDALDLIDRAEANAYRALVMQRRRGHEYMSPGSATPGDS